MPMHRRALLPGGLATLALAACADAAPPPPPEQPAAAPVAAESQVQSQSFDAFLAGVRAEAARGGVSQATLARALSGVRPNQRVIELDRRQAEFTQTWPQYRDARLSPARIENGRRAMAENRATLDAAEARFRVDRRVVVAIWGIETSYGRVTGDFSVVEALATLAWEGRRAAFFRAELLAALRILDAGHVNAERMRGSHAGAMGHGQFMPTSFERLAVDMDGDGRRDIWDSRADALGSIANYLARSGWREGLWWGHEVAVPAGFDAVGFDHTRTLPPERWSAMGVRRLDGRALPGVDGAVVSPGASRGPFQSFWVSPNFTAIRRYNPSNFYAVAVGLLADAVG